MKDTLEILSTYLELLEVPKEKASRLLKSKEIQLYAYLRDKLTYTELLDLEIVLNNIYNGVENKNKINFNEYCLIDKKYKTSACSLLLHNCISSKYCMYALSTIIAMEPKEVALNYL